MHVLGADAGAESEFAFVIQCVGLGGVVGTYVALYRHHRDPATRTELIVLRWGALGGIIGVIALLSDAVT